MTRNLLLFEILAISLFTLASAVDNNIPQPCRIQSIGDQLRCVVPVGYKVRSGDCPGNEIWALYRGSSTLEECAHLCSSFHECQAFMFHDNQRCYPKTKTCGTTDESDPLNVFYDKVPSGYTMRPGDCLGNIIWDLYKGTRMTRQECAKLCDSSAACNAFLDFIYLGRYHDCMPKTKGCGITSLTNSLDIFYDKVPEGYSLRPGDCPGNDILEIRGAVSLSECANRCNSDANCISFMYSDGECYPKTRTCAQPSTDYPMDVFYDKVPKGYAMRPGDCPGNDVWSIHGFVSLTECARRCSNHPECVSFKFSDGRVCYPKTKTCQVTEKGYPKDFFYDKIVKIPDGYFPRPGDCPGNDILEIRGSVSLSECAKRCDSDGFCISFMYSDGECYPKTRTCAQPSTNYPKDVFYDKYPRGYMMRPGDCPGNGLDIVFIPESIPMYLELCALICSDHPECVAFMFFDGHGCYPKSKTCIETDKGNPKNFFYDKLTII